MANPNKTVAAARRRMGGFPPRHPRPIEPFTQWLIDYARSHSGPCPWATIEEARAAYDAEKASHDQ